MITGQHTRGVVLTELLLKRLPVLANRLAEVLSNNSVPVQWVKNTNDLWCRDFLPAWVSNTECIQFRFEPKYYREKKYQSWRTDPQQVLPQLELRPCFSDITLDGGNIVSSDETAVMTERIFEDNPQYDRDHLLETLRDLLRVKTIIILPVLPGDITGHTDGMLRFKDERTVLVNDFSQIAPARMNRQIHSLLQNAGLEITIVPNTLNLNRSSDDLSGDYINFLEVDNLIVLPSYRTAMDEEVYNLYRAVFPSRQIVQVDVSELTVLGGGLNCASWCYP